MLYIMQKIINVSVIVGFLINSYMSYYAVSKDSKEELKTELKQEIALKVSKLEWTYKNKEQDAKIKSLENCIIEQTKATKEQVSVNYDIKLAMNELNGHLDKFSENYSRLEGSIKNHGKRINKLERR